MKKTSLQTLRHIFAARIDNAETFAEREIWHTARDIVEYALADNTEILNLFDYLPTTED